MCIRDRDCEQLELDGLPTSQLGQVEGQPLTSLFVESGLAKNGSQVKDALQRNAVLVNGNAIGMEQNMTASEIFIAANALHKAYFIVRLGKKSYHLYKF